MSLRIAQFLLSARSFPPFGTLSGLAAGALEDANWTVGSTAAARAILLPGLPGQFRCGGGMLTLAEDNEGGLLVSVAYE